MSDPSPGIPPQRIPLAIGAAVVTIAAVVAIAVGVNGASTAAVPTPTPAVTPTPSPSPTPVTVVPYADCSKATFGPALASLNPPKDVHKYPKAPAFTIDSAKLYRATITTKRGDIVLCLQPKLAPNTVNNFVTLARNHFYDGIPFHRVVAGFVVQGGDPNCIGHVPSPPATPPPSCGSGGSGYQFNDEPVHQFYVLGALAMANSGPNTNGSQFFICIADDTKTLKNLYNLFGNVESGLNIAQAIKQGDVMERITVSESR